MGEVIQFPGRFRRQTSVDLPKPEVRWPLAKKLLRLGPCTGAASPWLSSVSYSMEFKCRQFNCRSNPDLFIQEMTSIHPRAEDAVAALVSAGLPSLNGFLEELLELYATADVGDEFRLQKFDDLRADDLARLFDAALSGWGVDVPA